MGNDKGSTVWEKKAPGWVSVLESSSLADALQVCVPQVAVAPHSVPSLFAIVLVLALSLSWEV